MRVCSLCQRCYDDSVVSCADEGHPVLSETLDGSPEMIAGYRLESLLETGRNGEIYRGIHTSSGASCLIKILSAEAQNSQQFLHEARIAAAFFHPNIADVYEAGSLECGKNFVVSEDAEGQTLREVLENVGIPQLLTSVEIVRQAAEALHAIHMKGLMHHAVNPENIVLTTDLEHRLLVKIQNIDFGGVVEQSIVSNKFLIDSALDSLKYFAPEQCSGDLANAQTDVYGLGIVFYEMLAGVPPFDAAKAAGLIEKHRTQPPPEIRIDDFNLRMLLTHTLMESLQKQPGMRQSSANLFARQLRHVEQLATHVSTPPPAGVVPPAPQKSAPRVPVAVVSPSSTIQPVMETLATFHRENLQPLTASVETDPVRVEREFVPAIGPEIPADDRPEIPRSLFEEPAIEVVMEKTVPRRSRLKLHRKRPHTKIAAPGMLEAMQVAPVQTQPVVAEIIAHQSKTGEIAVDTVPITPTKVAWEQPDDDIPSVADVMEVLASEQITEIPVLEAEPESIETVSPRKIEWSQPVDMPLAAQVSEALSRENTEMPVVEEEPEEITIVRAPSRRIKIEWEQPAAVQGFLHRESFSSPAADDLSFFPTILGDIQNKRMIDLDATDSFLSDYYDPPRTAFSVPHRSLMIGVGVLALTALFLFGDDLMGRYASTESSSDSVATTTTTSAKGTQPPALQANTALPPAKKGLKTSERSLPDSYVADADKPQPMPTKVGLSLSSEKPKTTAAKNAGKTPFVPPMPLRSPNNGKVKSKAQPEKISGMPTRPRIVKDPQP